VPYSPDKNSVDKWLSCLKNSDLVFSLLSGAAPDLTGCVDFPSPEARAEAWRTNRAMIMSLRGIGWDPHGSLEQDPWTYAVGTRPRAYFEELGVDLGDRHGYDPRFDAKQFEYLREHKLLEPGEEELVKKFLARIADLPGRKMYVV